MHTAEPQRVTKYGVCTYMYISSTPGASSPFWFTLIVIMCDFKLGFLCERCLRMRYMHAEHFSPYVQVHMKMPHTVHASPRPRSTAVHHCPPRRSYRVNTRMRLGYSVQYVQYGSKMIEVRTLGRGDSARNLGEDSAAKYICRSIDSHMLHNAPELRSEQPVHSIFSISFQVQGALTSW